MLVLSTRWPVAFGQFTLNAALTSDDLDRAIAGSASMLVVPAEPTNEVKIASPCGLLDPNGPATTHHFLDGSGNTWVGVGTRLVSNTPNPALVEARFRARAVEEFGDSWHLAKKKRLAGLRKGTRRDMAVQTPFRLGEAGALFVCIQTGAVVVVGHAGVLVAKDMVGRVSALTRVSFRVPSANNLPPLLAILRKQEESILPWPTGTAALRRKRGDVKESASVKKLSWAENSSDAADLLTQQWRPGKIEMQWGDGRLGSVDATGGLISVGWGGRLNEADPCSRIEARLARLLEMDGQVQALISEVRGALLPVEA